MHYSSSFHALIFVAPSFSAICLYQIAACDHVLQSECSRRTPDHQDFPIHRKLFRRICPLGKYETQPQNFRRQLKQLDENLQEVPPMDKEVHLLAFRIIGCSVVTIFVGLTIIIYVTSSMLYQDCIAQICSEICLLAAYTCILLITTDTTKKDSVFCTGIAIGLHFLFVACFLFMLLEVVCMCRLLFEIFPTDFLSSTRSILLLGWGIPTILVGISAITLYGQYSSRTNCWSTIGKNSFWPTIIPIGACAGLQFILLIIVLTVSHVPFDLPDPEYERAKNFLMTRWASMVILVTTASAWGFGMAASHYNHEPYYGAFTVISVFMGVVIFILRISTDYEIRKMMLMNVICFIRPNNRVTAWTEVKLPKKKIAIISNPANGNSHR